jgi:hypothetical protein
VGLGLPAGGPVGLAVGLAVGLPEAGGLCTVVGWRAESLGLGTDVGLVLAGVARLRLGVGDGVTEGAGDLGFKLGPDRFESAGFWPGAGDGRVR